MFNKRTWAGLARVAVVYVPIYIGAAAILQPHAVAQQGVLGFLCAVFAADIEPGVTRVLLRLFHFLAWRKA